MRINRLDLLGKGWTSAEVNHAEHILKKAEHKKHRNIKILDNTTYWVLLFTLMIGNIICSIFLIPFLFVIKDFFVVLIVALLGFLFGALYSIVIIDIEKVGIQNHASLMISLFLSGILSFGLILIFAENFSSRTGLMLVHNPYIIAGVYFLAFVMPHTVFLVNKGRQNNKF